MQPFAITYIMFFLSLFFHVDKKLRKKNVSALPVQQQLQYRMRAGKGSVGGEEDGGVGEVVVSESRQQRLYQALQSPSADAADFAGFQLAHRVAGRQAIALRLNTSKRLVRLLHQNTFRPLLHGSCFGHYQMEQGYRKILL